MWGGCVGVNSGGVNSVLVSYGYKTNCRTTQQCRSVKLRFRCEFIIITTLQYSKYRNMFDKFSNLKMTNSPWLQKMVFSLQKTKWLFFFTPKKVSNWHCLHVRVGNYGPESRSRVTFAYCHWKKLHLIEQSSGVTPKSSTLRLSLIFKFNSCQRNKLNHHKISNQLGLITMFFLKLCRKEFPGILLLHCSHNSDSNVLFLYSLRWEYWSVLKNHSSSQALQFCMTVFVSLGSGACACFPFVIN